MPRGVLLSETVTGHSRCTAAHTCGEVLDSMSEQQQRGHAQMAGKSSQPAAAYAALCTVPYQQCATHVMSDAAVRKP
jgi:hypothetical protein